jgi:hypothetical protein
MPGSMKSLQLFRSPSKRQQHRHQLIEPYRYYFENSTYMVLFFFVVPLQLGNTLLVVRYQYDKQTGKESNQRVHKRP